MMPLSFPHSACYAEVIPDKGAYSGSADSILQRGMSDSRTVLWLGLHAPSQNTYLSD